MSTTISLTSRENALIEARQSLLRQATGELDAMAYTTSFLESKLQEAVSALLIEHGITEAVRTEFDFDKCEMRILVEGGETPTVEGRDNAETETDDMGSGIQTVA